MQDFGNCPMCGSSLTNIFNDLNDSIIYKSCHLRTTHIFRAVFFTRVNITERVAFTLSMSPLKSVMITDEQSIRIGKGAPGEHADLRDDGPLIHIPYFEPDFSDCKKLINKIKLLVLFS